MRKIYPAVLAAALTVLMSACGDYPEDTGETESIPVTVTHKSLYYTAAAESTASSVTSTELSTQTTTETTTETTVTETESERSETTALPFEDTPENAYIRLNSAFEMEDGVLYPDDYSGSYSYAGTLFVAITTYNPSDFYRGILSDYTCVQYVTVSKSLNQLTDIGKRAAELLEPEFGVYEYYADVPSNKAAVSILSGDPKSAQNYLKTVTDLGFYLEDLEISMEQTE